MSGLILDLIYRGRPALAAKSRLGRTRYGSQKCFRGHRLSRTLVSHNPVPKYPAPCIPLTPECTCVNTNKTMFITLCSPVSHCACIAVNPCMYTAQQSWCFACTISNQMKSDQWSTQSCVIKCCYLQYGMSLCNMHNYFRICIANLTFDSSVVSVWKSNYKQASHSLEHEGHVYTWSDLSIDATLTAIITMSLMFVSIGCTVHLWSPCVMHAKKHACRAPVYIHIHAITSNYQNNYAKSNSHWSWWAIVM